MENIYGVEDGFSEFDYLNIGGRGRYYRELIRFMYFELQKKENRIQINSYRIY